jgi:putative intracellular protease/amidase
MKLLMVLTSHDKLGNTGRKTGFWLEEFAAPYYTFKEAGAEIVLASPKGGQPPLDPKSNEPNFQTDLTHRFEADADAKAQLATTVRLDSVRAEDFDTVFYPGGHGPMWDLAEDQNSVRLLETMFRAGKPIALVCHAPGALRHVKTSDGKPLVQGKRVTLHQHRGRGGRSHQGGAFPRRGRVEGEGRYLFQGRRLAALRPHRRPADHRSESGLVGSRGESSRRSDEQDGQLVHTSAIQLRKTQRRIKCSRLYLALVAVRH